MRTFTIHFPDSEHGDLSLPVGARLSEHLTATNAPLLFGCRTGICGTCLVRVQGACDPPDDDEQEMIEIFAPDDDQARLACRLHCTGDIAIAPHPDAP